MEFTEKEKNAIKRRLKRSAPVWNASKFEEVLGLLSKAKSSEEFRKDWYIDKVITHEELIGELGLTQFIQ